MLRAWNRKDGETLCVGKEDKVQCSLVTPTGLGSFGMRCNNDERTVAYMEKVLTLLE